MRDRKILVIDGEHHIREMLKMAFGGAGFSVFSANCAEEALEILKKEPIRLMFIDLGLENMNGFELCETIRKDIPYAIIYALTGFAGKLGRHEITEAGFDGCLAKPITVVTLYKVIKKSFIRLDKLI